MTTLTPGSNDWLAQVREPIIDPAREIIDPHITSGAIALAKIIFLTNSGRTPAQVTR